MNVIFVKRMIHFRINEKIQMSNIKNNAEKNWKSVNIQQS